MKLPESYFDGKEFGTTLASFGQWVEENKPEEIEMTEKQFWEFTKLQPVPYEERYWNTFHGIPLRCPEMTGSQQRALRIWNYQKTDETE